MATEERGKSSSKKFPIFGATRLKNLFVLCAFPVPVPVMRGEPKRVAFFSWNNGIASSSISLLFFPKNRVARKYPFSISFKAIVKAF